MKKISLAFMLLTMSLASQAEIVSGDYIEAGDQKVSLDSQTGLEWLSITETAGFSINEISELISEGSYEGFRLATESEIRDVWDYFFYVESQRLKENGLEEYYDTFGYVYWASGTVKFSYGLVDKEDGSGVALYGNRSDGKQSYFDYQGQPYDLNHAHDAYGVYLVSEGGYTYSNLNDESYQNIQSNPHSDVPYNGYGMAVVIFSLFSFFGRRVKLS